MINLIVDSHLGQNRKSSGLPYVFHPFKVALRLLYAANSPVRGLCEPASGSENFERRQRLAEFLRNLYNEDAEIKAEAYLDLEEAISAAAQGVLEELVDHSSMPRHRFFAHIREIEGIIKVAVQPLWATNHINITFMLPLTEEDIIDSPRKLDL